MKNEKPEFLNNRNFLLKLKQKRNCYICSSFENLHIHHKTYKNFRREELRDVVVLCRKCHIFLHRLKRNSKKLTKNLTKPHHINLNKKKWKKLYYILNLSGR